MRIHYTGFCIKCDKPTEVEFTDNQAVRFSKRGFTPIQDALPDLSIDSREKLISGMHSDCFNGSSEDFGRNAGEEKLA